jgi:protein-tyrosine-phosphatase
MRIAAALRRLWADPVWSKVIAAGIVAVLSLLFMAVSTRIASVPFPRRAAIIASIVLVSSAVLYAFVLMYSRRGTKTLVFLSAGGTCRDPMAKAIAMKLLETRNLRNRLQIRAAGLGPVSKPEVSYAARYVIKEMYNEDLLAGQKPELLTPSLVKQADLILAMDRAILLTPGKNLPADKTFLLKEFFGSNGDICDPWPDGKDVATLNRYRACAKELKEILTNNLDHLVKVLDL